MLIYTQLQKAGTLVVIPMSQLFWEGCYLFQGVSSSTRDLHDGEVLCVQCVCVVYAWTLALSRISFLKTNPPSVLLLVPLSLSLSLPRLLFPCPPEQVVIVRVRPAARIECVLAAARLTSGSSNALLRGPMGEGQYHREGGNTSDGLHLYLSTDGRVLCSPFLGAVERYR